MATASTRWHRTRFAILLAPALLGGCYVVPIVPVLRPYYRPHPHYRGYYQVGQVEARKADALVAAGSSSAMGDIEVAGAAP